MSQHSNLIQATVAALLLAVGAAAHAAPQEIVKLPRVVVVGKASPAAVQVAKIEVLPRVVVVGQAQQQPQQHPQPQPQPQQLLASTAPTAPVAVRFIARAL